MASTMENLPRAFNYRHSARWGWSPSLQKEHFTFLSIEGNSTGRNVNGTNRCPFSKPRESDPETAWSMQCRAKSSCLAPTVRAKQATSEWSSWQLAVWSPWTRWQMWIRRWLLRRLSTNTPLRPVSLWSLRWRISTETLEERGNYISPLIKPLKY